MTIPEAPLIPTISRGRGPVSAAFPLIRQVYQAGGGKRKRRVTGAGLGALISRPLVYEVHMALQGTIQDLTEKHKKLELLIAAEMAHPDWDETRVAALKKQKLRIKDELERLRGSIH